LDGDVRVQQPVAFISHASEDKPDFAEPLARELASLGIRAWLDKWEIKPGDSVVRKLFDEGLATAQAVVVVISDNSVSKPWVREELDAAMVARINGETRLIPVRLDGADVPPPLRHLVWITAERSDQGVQKAARQIADTIFGKDVRPSVAAPPAYLSTSPIPGLSAADTALLDILGRDAIDHDALIGLSWQRIEAAAAEKALSAEELAESLAALQHRHYVKILHVAGTPHTIELSSPAFGRILDTNAP